MSKNPPQNDSGLVPGRPSCPLLVVRPEGVCVVTLTPGAMAPPAAREAGGDPVVLAPARPGVRFQQSILWVDAITLLLPPLSGPGRIPAPGPEDLPESG